MAATLPRAAAPVEIVVWHGYRGGEKTAFEKVVAAYNASRASRGVKVSTLAVPYDAYPDKISATVPRGKGPDVFIYAQDRLGGWIEAGNTIEPIGFYVDAKTRARFLPATLEAMTYRGEIYGLPLNYKVITMIYNRKLVARPPATSGELVTVAKKLTDASTGRFGLAYWYANFYYHAPLMNAFGGGAFDANRKPRLNAAENIRSLNLLMKWVDKDRILPAESSTALVTSLFNEGKAAIVFSGPWFVGEIAPGDRLRPRPAAHARRGGRSADAALDDASRASTSRAPSAHKDAGLRLRQLPHGGRSGEGPRRRRAADAGEPAGLRRSGGGGRSDPQGLPPAVRHRHPDAELPGDDDGVVAALTAMNSIVQRAATPQAAMDAAQREVEQAIQRLRK